MTKKNPRYEDGYTRFVDGVVNKWRCFADWWSKTLIARIYGGERYKRNARLTGTLNVLTLLVFLELPFLYAYAFSPLKDLNDFRISEGVLVNVGGPSTNFPFNVYTITKNGKNLSFRGTAIPKTRNEAKSNVGLVTKVYWVTKKEPFRPFFYKKLVQLEVNNEILISYQMLKTSEAKKKKMTRFLTVLLSVFVAYPVFRFFLKKEK